jgi:hypothetical protein
MKNIDKNLNTTFLTILKLNVKHVRKPRNNGSRQFDREKYKNQYKIVSHTGNTVQDYIWSKLKNRHNDHKLRKLVSRCPCNTKHHISNRYKYFKMIQEHLDRTIRNMVNTKNDHSASYNKTCLQTVKIRYQGGAESSDKGGCCETKGGRSETFPPPLPAHHSRSQPSQTKNTTEQQATKQQEDNMPSDRMTAIKEVQADILSTLKKTSYFTNETTRAHINSLHLDDFNLLKRITKGREITCERAIKACIDGQQLAPRKTEYKYHYRLFAEYMEILQIELDRIFEIQDYMEDQEEMFKFKTEHYQEYRFHPIHERQPTPFVQNIVTTNIRRESPSPECSPVRESFVQIIRNFSLSSDDSDTESDTTKKQAWSADDSSDSSSDEDD